MKRFLFSFLAVIVLAIAVVSTTPKDADAAVTQYYDVTYEFAQFYCEDGEPHALIYVNGSIVVEVYDFDETGTISVPETATIKVVVEDVEFQNAVNHDFEKTG